MNVLYLTINPNRASTTVPTEGWFRCLRPLGLSPVLASNETGAFHEWACDNQIPAYHVPLPHPSKRNPIPFFTSLWKLRRILKKHRIELIHCNEQDCYPIGSYLARMSRLPVVVTVHFTMEAGFCSWAFGGRRQPDRMYFVSQRNLDACKAALLPHVPVDRWRVLHNGIDLQHHSQSSEMRRDFRRKLGIDDCLAVGVACALRPRKQIEHLIDAAAGLDRADVRVLLAGGPVPGDESYAQSLIESCRRKLGPRFHYLGHVDDVRPFCSALDLFVNTSREESFGIAVLEAMAAGCPVVGYDSMAVDEVVLPDGGEITPQDDIERLAAAMSRWLSDPVRLQTARACARAQAERFDIRNLSNQLWNSYRELLGNPVRALRKQARAAAATTCNS